MITHHSYYTKDGEDDVFLLHDDKSFYSVIVIRREGTFVDGMGGRLPPSTLEYCKKFIR